MLTVRQSVSSSQIVFGNSLSIKCSMYYGLFGKLTVWLWFLYSFNYLLLNSNKRFNVLSHISQPMSYNLRQRRQRWYDSNCLLLLSICEQNIAETFVWILIRLCTIVSLAPRWLLEKPGSRVGWNCTAIMACAFWMPTSSYKILNTRLL